MIINKRKNRSLFLSLELISPRIQLRFNFDSTSIGRVIEQHFHLLTFLSQHLQSKQLLMLNQFLLFKTLFLLLQFSLIQSWNPIKSSSKLHNSHSNDLNPVTNDNTMKESSSEVEALLNSMAQRLSSQSSNVSPPLSPSNPSCFYLALSSLPSSSPCELLSRSELKRVEISTSMALCEIKTGLGTIPRECQEWQEGNGKVVGNCVEALARSPQSWCSYSGYLREVVTICSSYRRWSDLETAKQLHSESATKFSDFVETLKQYETARELREYDESLAKDRILTHLNSLSSELGFLSQGLSSQQIQRTEEFSTLHNNLIIALQKFDNELINSLDRELGIVSTAIVRQEKDLKDLLEKSLTGLINQIQNDLSLTTSNVDIQLRNSLDSFQPSLRLVVDQLDDLHIGIEKNTNLVNQANKVLTTVVSNGDEVASSLSESLRLAHDLLTTQELTLEAHRIQVVNLTERIEFLLHSQPHSFGIVNWLGKFSNIWCWDVMSRLLSNGIGFKQLSFTLLRYFVGSSYPWLGQILIILASLTTLYPTLTLLYKFIQIISHLRSFIPSHQSKRTRDELLQIEYRPTSTRNNPKFRRIDNDIRSNKVARRMSRIPNFFWMED